MLGGGNSSLVWLKEKAVLSIIYNRDILILRRLLRGQLNVSEDPGLQVVLSLVAMPFHINRIGDTDF
jgi:hypothetical protein